MKELIRDRVKSAIEESVFPGCVIGVVSEKDRQILPFGRLTYEINSRPVQVETVYDLASITKKVANSSVLLRLIDNGRVGLDDPVVKYLPEFGNHSGKEQVTIKHLLTYTLDIEVPSASSFKDRPAEEIIEVMIQAPLKSRPGEKVLYTNSTAILRGLVIRAVTGQGLEVLAREYFFDSLEMKSTTFQPEKLDRSVIAPTEVDTWRKREICGEVHDESTYTLQRAGYYLGAAGLFSTAGDLLTFASMLLSGGVYKGCRYFSPALIEAMQTDQCPKLEQSIGLGWDLNSKFKMGELSSDRAFGHSGFTGTMVVIDPVHKLGLVILSNCTYPKRPLDNRAINRFRRDIADIIFKEYSSK